MKSPSYDRKHSKAPKKKRYPKKKVVAKPLEEEEVVWFSNPSKEAARARREEAKDIMGRELWKMIMEDSSDEDDDEQEEEFYFYDGGWHSSPQPHVPHLESTIKGDSSQEKVDSQGFDVGEGCSPKDVVCLEDSNNSVNNHITVVRVCVSETKKELADKSDVNDADGDRNGLESVLKIEVPNDKDSLKMPEPVEIAQEKEKRIVVFEHVDTQRDDDDVAVSNDADMEPQITETTQTKVATLVDIDEEGPPIDASNQVASVSIIESVFESNREHSSGGFQHKIRGWTRYIGRKIGGWAANICRTLTPCCIKHTQTTKAS